MAKRRIEDEIEALGRVRGAPRSEAIAVLRKALGDRVNLVVAKSARLAAELALDDLIPDLLRAFDRLMDHAAERDPQCWGKVALAKALTELNHSDSLVYLRGARHVQMEPVWGRVEDMAAGLRGICLLALVTCPDIGRVDVLRHLVDGLTDPAHTVRVEAVRAIQQMAGDDGTLLLYFKARIGDEEPAVLGQVFDSLLGLERERAVAFVAGYLQSGPQAPRHEAALSLGASRLPGTTDLLRETWQTAREQEFRTVLLRALASSRDQSALDFLADVAKNGRTQDAAAAREALAMLSSTPAPQSR
jgi:hypothetical protein